MFEGLAGFRYRKSDNAEKRLAMKQKLQSSHSLVKMVDEDEFINEIMDNNRK